VYKFKEIERLHMEISSLCQASCPMCARNYHGGLPNPKLPEKNLRLDFFKTALTSNFLKQLKTITMSGNYGDPIMNNDLIDMVRYAAEQNPDITIYIYTNGSARSIKWWTELANALPRNHLVFFGIDGLADTHSLYRIGTNFNTIIRNAKTFIDNGGKAQWNFITFQHNQHQLDECRKLAEELGFVRFQEKQTTRFVGSNEFKVLDKTGTEIYKLSTPVESKIEFIDKDTIKNYKSLFDTATISCEAEREKRIYIDAQGHLWPSCYIGSVLYQYSLPDDITNDFVNDSISSLRDTITEFGGLEGLDLKNKSIEEIVDSEEWQTVWNKKFENRSLLMCVRVCGKFAEDKISQPQEGLLELKEFNV
jgi:MoaA/NifB/PqqE/SkfB family radical SAM enzyme